MFARPSILHTRDYDKWYEESKMALIFKEIVQQSSSLCVRKLLLKDILARLKIFSEPGSLVPIFFEALSI